MAAPMKELAAEFTRATGFTTEFDLGGSETLLPKLLAGASADIYVCHDPFESKIKQAGRWAETVTVGSMQPVVAVPPGNPKALHTANDLLQTGLRIGIGDPRYSTCGELFIGALNKRGIRTQVMPQVVMQARSTSDVANGLLVGSLDVAVVWNFTTVLYSNRLEVVDLGLAYQDVRVTIIALTDSQQPSIRDRFMQWCARPETKLLFQHYGYTARTKPTNAKVP